MALAEHKPGLKRYIGEVVPTAEDAHAFFDQKERPDTLKKIPCIGCDVYFGEYMKHPKSVALAETLSGFCVAQQPPKAISISRLVDIPCFVREYD